jgi:hypothetical protein
MGLEFDGNALRKEFTEIKSQAPQCLDQVVLLWIQDEIDHLEGVSPEEFLALWDEVTKIAEENGCPVTQEQKKDIAESCFISAPKETYALLLRTFSLDPKPLIVAEIKDRYIEGDFDVTAETWRRLMWLYREMSIPWFGLSDPLLTELLLSKSVVQDASSDLEEGDVYTSLLEELDINYLDLAAAAKGLDLYHETSGLAMMLANHITEKTLNRQEVIDLLEEKDLIDSPLVGLNALRSIVWHQNERYERGTFFGADDHQEFKKYLALQIIFDEGILENPQTEKTARLILEEGNSHLEEERTSWKLHGKTLWDLANLLPPERDPTPKELADLEKELQEDNDYYLNKQ